MSVVWSCSEWDPLAEVVVGTPQNAKYPTADKSAQFVVFPERPLDSLPTGDFSARVLSETEEDLSKLVNVLQQQGITVRRPEPPDNHRTFSTTHWKAQGFHCYCPRDILTVIGDVIIESPNAMRSRFFESFAYRPILLDYLKSGARWVGAPKPMLLDSLYEPSGVAERVLKNDEPVFDAANILRCGYDLLFLVSSTGNELGAQWLQQTLGTKYKVHLVKDVYYGSHIDSTFAMLRPGLVLCNPARVNESNFPPLLKKWKAIYSPPMVPGALCGIDPIGSDWIGMNLLSLSPNLVVVEKEQVPLIKLLERQGLDVIPLSLRHGRLLGGGFHCVTLDVRRKGTMENYF